MYLLLYVEVIMFSLPKQFQDNIELETRRNGCWLWTGYISNGYGLIKWAGKVRSAHRTAYELLVGPISVGLEIDHLCRVKNCVNPDHLEPVTHRENCARGENYNSNKTHCINGHAFDSENTYIIPSSGGRQCRICAREKNRRWGDSRRSLRI